MAEREPLLNRRGGNAQPNLLNLNAITQQATQLNNDVVQLQRLAEQVGTSRDSEELRHDLTTKREECANLAKNIMLALKSIKIDRSEKARHDKLVSQVNDIFTRMQRISQDSIQKERMAPIASRPKQSIRTSTESPTYREQEEQRQQQRSVQQMRVQQYDIDNQILEERNTEIKQLEGELQGLNEMFVDIAQMIKEQGEDIITIESNTEKGLQHMEEGVNQLQKASEYQKSSRTKLCCILLIIVLIVGVIAAFLGIYCGAMGKC